MVESPSFRFCGALICDYAVEGEDGKQTYAGVYSDDIVVEPDRESPVPFFLSLTIQPFKNNGTVFVELKGPGIALRTQMGFAGDGAAVTPRDRIVFTPKVEFPRLELGQYVLSVGESFEMLEKVYDFFIVKVGEVYPLQTPIVVPPS